MKGHLKKVIVTVAATLLLCALCLGMFTGCSSGNTISVYIFCATSDANTNQTLIDRWAEEYYAEHEEELSAQGIDEISVDFTYNGDSDDYYDQLANRVAAGSAADIIYVSPRNIKSYASNGIVLDLTDYVDWSKYGNGSDIWEGALASFTYSEETNTVGQDVTISGSNETGYTATATDTGEGVGIYAAPKDYSSFGLAYNKNFFTNTLKDAYVNASGEDAYTPPSDSVFYWDGSGWQASNSYIKIGATMKYNTYNFYRYDNYTDALNDGDPIAELSARNGGYEVTIPGWPGDTYEYTTATEEGAGYDTSLGYVTYTYAEYSAMTYAVCWFAQIADRDLDGTHTLMTWLNSNDYTTHTPDSYDNEDRNIPQKQNYVYGNDQYEGSLYLAAWLLGNDTNFIDDTYTSVDARETWAEADNWRDSNWEDSGNYDSDGDGLIDTFVTEDYGINSENFVEAYAAFLAYGSDWNGNSFFSGSPEGESSKGGFAAMLNGRCVFYGVGTWDLQQFNNSSIDKLNVGIMPTPVSEDYAIASKVKDYQYKAAYYYNDYYGNASEYKNTTESDSDDFAWESELDGAQGTDSGYTRVANNSDAAAAYDPYDENWEITSSSMSSTWKTLMDARQNEWYARIDTVGFAVNADMLDDPEWKIEAAADLCAYLAMGEDAQVALTYSGSQLSSLKDQCEDYVFYQQDGYAEDGSFNKMITPDGIISEDGTTELSVSVSEMNYVLQYYMGSLGYSSDGYDPNGVLTEDLYNEINDLFSVMDEGGESYTLRGSQVWYFAVGVVNFLYNNPSVSLTFSQMIARAFPSLTDYVNQYYKDFDTTQFDAFGGRNAAYKCLNMVSVDYAARNLQVRMAALNGRQDTSTYTYSDSWINTVFPYFKSTALITYNTNRDTNALDLLDETDLCIDLYYSKYGTEATAQSQLTEFFQTITVSSGQGTFYTPATYCLTIVSYVQYDLGANSLMEELQRMS